MMLQLTELVKPYKTTDLSWLHEKMECWERSHATLYKK
jgi:hypothetical protein